MEISVATMSILPGIHNEKPPSSFEELNLADCGAYTEILFNHQRLFLHLGLSLYSSHSTEPSPPHPSLLPGEEALAISWALG
jgi:hypothetical protein